MSSERIGIRSPACARTSRRRSCATPRRAAASRSRVLYPGLHAIWAHRLWHALWVRRVRFVARAGSQITRWLTGIEIHPGATIGRRFFIDHGMGVVIGETAEVGDDVMLYHGVTLGGRQREGGKRHPTIEDGVAVGAGAKILGPITIGAHSVVGANAVVTRDAPADSVLVGVPAQAAIPQGGRGHARASDGARVLDLTLADLDVARPDQAIADQDVRRMRSIPELVPIVLNPVARAEASVTRRGAPRPSS